MVQQLQPFNIWPLMKLQLFVILAIFNKAWSKFDLKKKEVTASIMNGMHTSNNNVAVAINLKRTCCLSACVSSSCLLGANSRCEHAWVCLCHTVKISRGEQAACVWFLLHCMHLFQEQRDGDRERDRKKERKGERKRERETASIATYVEIEFNP